MTEPKLLRGFRDYLPAQVGARLKMIDTIRSVYERYGFVPLETPALEYAATLTGHSDESTKQIFRLRSPEDEEIGLRFDLTVPLARVVAQYPDLPKPFRRYQVGPVWRADKPDPGRFREFYQFDLDTVGSSSMLADAEVLCGMYDTLRALGIERFQIRFSSRKILSSLLEYAGVPQSLAHAVFRVLDKLDKAGLANVERELTAGRTDQSGDKIPGLGLATAQVASIKEFLGLPKGTRNQVLASLDTLFREVPAAAAGIGELREISASLEALGIPDERVFIDLSIARGLDYYTGPVFEANLLDAPEFGSIFGGGRYDGLVERFLGKKIPAVGASIGIDRLFAALQKLGLVSMRPSTAHVLVTVMDRSRLPAYQVATRELRQAGINAELYLGDEKGLGRQLQYANAMRVPVAVIMGEDEFAKDEVTVKDLRAGERLQQLKSGGEKDRDEWLKLSKTAQVTVSRGALIATVRGMLTPGG